MLGHKLAQLLGSRAQTIVTVRGEASSWPNNIPVAEVVGRVDVAESSRLGSILETYRPSAVLNAVGVVKQIVGSQDPAETVAINALFPRILAGLCESAGIRLIHYSTDCVYSGSRDSVRGADGYRECDPPDARDLYGMTKLLGEPQAKGCLVIRTSIIGRELRGRRSLVEWFLANVKGPVKGFSRAWFTGLTTLELAKVTAVILANYPDMEGLWHVSSAPIHKAELLALIDSSFGRHIGIQPDAEFFCDRRLDSTRFQRATGWSAPSWPQMIEAMRTDPFDYDAWETRHHG